MFTASRKREESRTADTAGLPWKRVLRDPVLLTIVCVAAVAYSIYYSPWLKSEEIRTSFARLSDIPLIVIAGACHLSRMFRASGKHERRFWGLWVAALSCWLGTYAFELWVPEALQQSPDFVLQHSLLFTGFYLCAALALEHDPPEASGLGPRSDHGRTEALAALVLVFGAFTYFGLIPLILGPGLGFQKASRPVLFILLDLYLIARLLILLRRASGRGRETYQALLAACLFWLGLDLTDAVVQAGVATAGTFDLLLQATWLGPFAALTLAARVQAGGEVAEGERPASEAADQALPGTSLLAGALAFAAVHIGLESLHRLPPETLAAQRLCALGTLSMLGVLAFVQQRLVQRQLSRSAALLGRKNAELKDAVSKLEESRDQAEAANRAKSQFLAVTSHEIRTPMTGILGVSDLLLASGLSEPQKRLTISLKRSAESLLAVINDILDISQVEAGKLTLNPAPFDPAEIVEDIAGLLAPMTRGRAVELASVIKNEVPAPLVGDASRLRQIVLNLAANALKFTAEGEVEIGLRLLSETERSATLLFDVRDTGSGIPPVMAERIFEPFVQGDSSPSRRHDGAGLGLAISRALATKMNGTIALESVAGLGSCFRFQVTLQKATDCVPRRELARRLAGLRAVAVDPSPLHLRALAACATRLGLEVSEVSRTELAPVLRLASLGGHPFAFVLFGGETVQETERALAAAMAPAGGPNGVRAILVTRSGAEGMPPASGNEGWIAGCLEKPIRLDTLAAALLRVLGAEAGDLMAPEQPAVFQPRFSGRVLVAEDNPVNQAVMEGYLKAFGLSIVTVPDGQAAVEAAAGGGFDLVLMDCMMPVMDGYRATAEIRRLETLSDLPRSPIVALTALAMAGDREQCLAAGMDDYVTKPIRPERLRTLLQEWLVPKPQLEGGVASPTLVPSSCGS